MKTSEALMAKYKDKFVKLDIIASDYYGIIDVTTVGRMAGKKEFPGLMPFKARNSKKAPWLVDIDNLADVLDARKRG